MGVTEKRETLVYREGQRANTDALNHIRCREEKIIKE